jgi:hypothetical protein
VKKRQFITLTIGHNALRIKTLFLCSLSRLRMIEQQHLDPGSPHPPRLFYAPIAEGGRLTLIRVAQISLIFERNK